MPAPLSDRLAVVPHRGRAVLAFHCHTDHRYYPVVGLLEPVHPNLDPSPRLSYSPLPHLPQP